MKEKILIVEDEKDIGRMLEYNLAKEGFKTVVCRDGEEAVGLARKEKPQLIVLDLMLPGMDGFEICKIAKSDDKLKAIPILMLTAKASESDKVVGLELGADDYVTKPFSPRELVARIKAILRRVQDTESSKEVFKAGDLSVDFSRIEVTVRGRVVELTAKEFELLKALIKARGRVLSRDFLLDTIWGFEHALEIQTRTVDVHIRTLRKKLKREAQRITTVKSYGYRFEGD